MRGTHGYGRSGQPAPVVGTVSVLLSFTFGPGSHLQTELEPTLQARVASSSKLFYLNAGITRLESPFLTGHSLECALAPGLYQGLQAYTIVSLSQNWASGS